ncbi:hypothetical protein TSUD_194260 [Trifolium subterraneum]|uniref:Retrovirus-related Pol polyprotein from transposon TNT 1-94-like beta-barrel domain-containing protein n=1 Tax=Trifolium subterraneum TaxID=3900 RepID=A0A2Z6P3N3_TRISU|nr:hypothetical protein TSUD_194260 [Trifolium subterraneum]
MVIQYERQFVSNNAGIDNDDKVLVNASDSRRGFGRGRGSNQNYGSKKHCTFCGKDNHVVDNCYRKHGFPQNYGRTANSNNVDYEVDHLDGQNGKVSDNTSNKSTEFFGLSKAQYEKLVNLLQTTPSINATPAHVNGASTSNNVYSQSGASDHICSNLAFFESHHEIVPIQVRMPNGTVAYAKIAGTVKFSSEFSVHDVLLVPEFHLNLVTSYSLSATDEIDPANLDMKTPPKRLEKFLEDASQNSDVDSLIDAKLSSTKLMKIPKKE